MRLVGDIALDAEVRAIASGEITDGASVIVNADGTVSSVSSSPDSLGDQSSAIYSGTYGMSANVYDTGQDKVLFIYSGPSNYGYSVVGTVSGSSISFGTPVVFSSATTYYLTATFDPDVGKTGIFWADYGDSTKGKACVATISGTSVSYGTTVTFNSNSASVPIKDSTYDTSEDKILVAYTESNSSSKIIAATISGTDISFGTPVEFLSTSTSEVTIQYDTNVNKSLVAYRNSNNSNKVDSRVVSLSGTSVTLGTETSLYSTGSADKLASTYDSTNNKIVVAFRPDTGTTHTKFVVATISGTSVSYGTEVTTGVNFDQSPCAENFSYNVSANKVIFAGRDGGNSYIQKYVSARVSGTSISMDTPVTYYSAANDSYQANSVYDPDQEKTILFYADGTAGAFVNPVTRVLTLGAGDNITTENFIGFAHAAYADGQKATVKTTGSIARNIPQQPSASDSLGSATVFESGALADGSGQGSLVSTFDSSNNRVIVAYTDQGNSSYGTVCVGTVSGTTITFGTPTVIESAFLFNFGITFDSNVNKVVIVYTHQPTSETGKAIVGTIDSSDNSISFGTPATFNSSANNSNNKVVFDSNSNKVGIFYRDWGNSQFGTAKVGTISGTDITFGSATVFESGDTQYINCTFDSSNNKIVVAYQDNGNSNYGTAIVGTISGTSISFGSAVVFESATTREVNVTFDSSNNKVVVVYQDNGNSGDGTAIVGTVSGTGISFGSATVFETGDTSRTTAVIGIAFDSNLNKVIVSYYDDADSDYGKYAIGTVSGTSISFATAATFNAATTKYTSTTFDSNENKAVIFYRDDGDSSKGKAIVLAPTGTLEDLTIGQQYFVQTDGTLGLSADDPSVIAGTAISGTDIIVKG